MKKTPAKTNAAQGEAPENRPDFEGALARLEAIVERLDDGNLPLAESLALFKEGTRLAKVCRDLLSDAELQVKTALQDVQDDADARLADRNETDDGDFDGQDR